MDFGLGMSLAGVSSRLELHVRERGNLRKDTATPVNLDFDARVPIPISVFPSTYRSDTTSTEEDSSKVKVEGQVDYESSRRQRGREGHDTRSSASRKENTTRVHEEEEDSSYYQGRRRRHQQPRDSTTRREETVRVYEDRDRRPKTSRREDINVSVYDREHERPKRDHDLEVERERSYREPYQRYSDANFNQETTYDREYRVTREEPSRYDTQIDVAERDYRQRSRPFADEYVEKRYYPSSNDEESYRYEQRTSVDSPEEHRHRDHHMGYYDDEGHYHSFRHGVHRAADRLGDRIAHPVHGGNRHRVHYDDAPAPPHVREESVEHEVYDREPVSAMPGRTRYVERGAPPGTITIPCHHIRIGDLLILQGRPCQVIRITTSAQTGQHRYLGVDLFTKQLQEESSFVSNPGPSVVVQNMLGPVFKQYRVLDIRDDGRVVAMTETGDVKQGLPVIDQGSLWTRLTDAFGNGRGSVRVLVINDSGRELAVDYKVVHGARL
ncbi:MAG: hypothetical protein M1831_000083 [Alyxoria varia]|nr:MAG: hypothetical protein M1831_000083 [Alyxoria varia]